MASEHLVSVKFLLCGRILTLIEVCLKREKYIYRFIYIEREKKRESSQLSVGLCVLHSQDITSWL